MLALVVAFLACSTPPAAPPEPTPAEPTPAEAPPAAAATPMADAVTVKQPRARAMPPGTPNSAAFMTLTNAGTADARVVSAAAAVSTAVELHTHTMVDGVMEMRQIPEIVVPAGGDAVLEPGGLHVMFIGLTGALEAGATIDLTLTFADGSSKAVAVPVEAIEPAPAH
jgi:copper(I)-binding protein